jgi:hypothetical protein
MIVSGFLGIHALKIPDRRMGFRSHRCSGPGIVFPAGVSVQALYIDIFPGIPQQWDAKKINTIEPSSPEEMITWMISPIDPGISPGVQFGKQCLNIRIDRGLSTVHIRSLPDLEGMDWSGCSGCIIDQN